MSFNTGDIIKNVKKRDNPIITWFGGICWVPIEFLRKERTIIILVKEVIIIRIDGNSDNTVNIRSSFILALISSGSSVELIVMPSSEIDIPGAANAAVHSKPKHTSDDMIHIRIFFFSMASVL